MPEPPALNAMIDLAKKRTRVYKGQWMKQARPLVYDEGKDMYETLCTVWSRAHHGIMPPKEPWQKWEITSVVFHLHGLRDEIELMAGLKWPTDWLVKEGFVANDSPRELMGIPRPEQHIDRANRGVTITIREVV